MSLVICFEIYSVNKFGMYGEIICCKNCKKDFFYFNEDYGVFCFENKIINTNIDYKINNKDNFIYHYNDFIIFKKQINDGIELQKGDIVHFVYNTCVGR